jgi:hypothetical protein
MLEMNNLDNKPTKESSYIFPVETCIDEPYRLDYDKIYISMPEGPWGQVESVSSSTRLKDDVDSGRDKSSQRSKYRERQLKKLLPEASITRYSHNEFSIKLRNQN